MLRITSRLLAVALCIVVLLMPVVLVSFLSDTLDVTTTTILPPLWSSALRGAATEIALHRFQAAVAAAFRADALVSRRIPIRGYPKNAFAWNASELCNNVAETLRPPTAPTRPAPDGTVKWGYTRAGDDARTLRDIMLEARMMGVESLVPAVLFPELRQTPIPPRTTQPVNASAGSTTTTSRPTTTTTSTTTTSTSTTTSTGTTTVTTTTTTAPGGYVPMSCPFPNLGLETVYFSAGLMRDDWRSTARTRAKLPGNGTMALSFLHCPLDAMQMQTINEDDASSHLLWPHLLPMVQWFPAALPASVLPAEAGCRRTVGDRQIGLLVSRLLDKKTYETATNYVEPTGRDSPRDGRTRTHTLTHPVRKPYKVDRTLSPSLSIAPTHSRVDTGSMGAVAITFDRQLALEALAPVPSLRDGKVPLAHQQYFDAKRKQAAHSHLTDVLRAIGGSAVGAIMWDALYDVGMVGVGEQRGIPAVPLAKMWEQPRRDTQTRCDLYSVTTSTTGSSSASASAKSGGSDASGGSTTLVPGATTTTTAAPAATAADGAAGRTSSVKSSFTIDQTRGRLRDFCPVQIERDTVRTGTNTFVANSPADVEHFREELSLLLDADGSVLDRHRTPPLHEVAAAASFFAQRFVGSDFELEANATEAMLVELGRQKLNISRASSAFQKLTRRQLAQAAAQTPEWRALRMQRQRRMQELITGPAVDFVESLEAALSGNSSSLVYIVPRQPTVQGVVGGLVAVTDLYVLDIVPRAVFDAQQESWLTSLNAQATVAERQSSQSAHPSSQVDTHSAFAFEDLGLRVARHSYPYRTGQYACSIDVTTGDDVKSPVDFELEQLRAASAASANRESDERSTLLGERCIAPSSFAVMRRISIVVLASDEDNILGVDIFSGPVAATVMANIVMSVLAMIFLFGAFDALFRPMRDLAGMLRHIADDQIREIAPTQLSRVREIRDAQLATEGLVQAVQLYSRFLPSRSLLMDSSEMEPRAASQRFVETQSTFIDAIITQFHKLKRIMKGGGDELKHGRPAFGGIVSLVEKGFKLGGSSADADADDKKNKSITKRKRKLQAAGSGDGGDDATAAGGGESGSGASGAGGNGGDADAATGKGGLKEVQVNGRKTLLGFRRKAKGGAAGAGGDLSDEELGSFGNNSSGGGGAGDDKSKALLLSNLEMTGENSDEEDALDEALVNTDLQEEYLRLRNELALAEQNASAQITGVPHTVWIKATYRSRRDPGRVRSTYEPKKHCSFRQTFHCGEDVYAMVLEEIRRRVSERTGEPLQLRDVGYDALPVTMGESGQVTSLDADLQGSRRIENTADFLRAVERSHGRPLYLAMIKTSKRNFVPWIHAGICVIATILMYQISKEWETTPISDIPRDAAKAIVVFLSLRFACNLLFSAMLLLWFCHVQSNFYNWMCLAVPEVAIACVLSAFTLDGLYVVFSAVSLGRVRFNAPYNPMMAVTSRYALIGHVLGDAMGMIPLGYAAAFEGSSVVSGSVAVAIFFSMLALLIAFFYQPLMSKIADLLPSQHLATCVGDTQDFSEWDAPSAAFVAAATAPSAAAVSVAAAPDADPDRPSEALAKTAAAMRAAAAAKLFAPQKPPPMNLCEREASIVKLTLRDTAAHVEKLGGIQMAQLVAAVTDLAAREAEVYGGLILRVMGTEVTVGFNCHHTQSFHVLNAAKFFFAMERAVRAKMAEWPLAKELDGPQLVGALVSGASLAVGYVGTAEARSVQHLGIGEVLLQHLLGLAEHLGAMFLTTRQTAGALQLQADFSRKTFEADRDMRSRARDRVIQSFNVGADRGVVVGGGGGAAASIEKKKDGGKKGAIVGRKAGGGGGGGGARSGSANARGKGALDDYATAEERIEAEKKKREMNAFAAFFAELDDATSDVDIILLHSMRVREVDGISITLPAYHRDRFRSALDLDGITVSAAPYERDLSVFEVTTALSAEDLAHFNREVETLLRGPPHVFAAQTVAGGGFAHYCTGHPGDFVAQRIKFVNASRNPTGRNVRFITPLGIGFRRVELRLAQLAANAKTREEIEEEEAERDAMDALDRATGAVAGSSRKAAAAAATTQKPRSAAAGGGGGGRSDLVLQRIGNKDNYTVYFTDL